MSRIKESLQSCQFLTHITPLIEHFLSQADLRLAHIHKQYEHITRRRTFSHVRRNFAHLNHAAICVQLGVMHRKLIFAGTRANIAHKSIVLLLDTTNTFAYTMNTVAFELVVDFCVARRYQVFFLEDKLVIITLTFHVNNQL